MSKILILFSTTDDHTKHICERLQQTIEKYDNQVELISMASLNFLSERSIDLNSYDKIVIGASIRYGKHKPEVYRFISDQLQTLDAKPNAFFSVNVVARKPEKNTPETNPYLKKFIKQIPWTPKNLAVFAGKINYKKYSFVDRTMIRFIMWMTKGPTAADTNIEFTNWQNVEAFAQLIHEMKE